MVARCSGFSVTSLRQFSGWDPARLVAPSKRGHAVSPAVLGFTRARGVSVSEEGKINATLSEMGRYAAAIWPMLVGLSFSRMGVIVGGYGSYQSSDGGLFGDGAVLVAGAAMVALIVIVAKRDIQLSDREVCLLLCVCASVESGALASLSVCSVRVIDSQQIRFLLCSLNCAAGSLAMLCWVWRIRSAGPKVSILFTFGALALSELVIFPCVFLSPAGGYAAAACASLFQLGLVRKSKEQPDVPTLDRALNRNEYLGSMRKGSSLLRISVVSGVGLGLMAIVVGLLRGFPDGSSIVFSRSARIGYMLLCVAACVVVILRGFSSRKRRSSVEIWIAVEAMAFLSLLLYAAFPDDLQWGAMVVTVLNAILVAYGQYLMLAFMDSGWRDPFYYCLGGWLVFFLPRALTRMLQMVTFGIMGNIQLMMVSIALFVAASGQVMTLMIMRTYKLDLDDSPEGKRVVLQGLMGLEVSPNNLFEVRFAAMRENAQELGRRFNLSDREIDVVALYALGFTQKRVGEQLFISPATVHEYVKRIYTKTDLHSRQEIIDYLKEHAS